jgi:hypothetical protein
MVVCIFQGCSKLKSNKQYKENKQMTDIEKAINLLEEIEDNLFDLMFNNTFELGGFAKEKVTETRNKIIEVLPTLDY